MMYHAGFSFMEVLVSLLLFSFIILGLDAAQMTSFQKTKISYYLSVAMQQLNNMIERLSVLRDENSQEVVQQWNKQNAIVLPQGKGEIHGHYPHYILSLYWGNTINRECKKIKIGRSGCLQLSILL